MRFCCNGQLWKKPISHWDHTDCCRWILEAQFSYKQYQTRTPFLNNRSFLCRFVFVFLFRFVFFKLTSYILIKRNPQAEAFWQYVMDYTSRCSMSTQIPLSKINCETWARWSIISSDFCHIDFACFSPIAAGFLFIWKAEIDDDQAVIQKRKWIAPFSILTRFFRASHFSKMVALNLDVRINLEW